MASACSYFVGLDLGQSADYSALAVLERQPRDSEHEAAIFHCNELFRWPLKTPYPRIVEDTARLVRSDELQGAVRDFDSREHRGTLSDIQSARESRETILAIDATGVGAPVVDLFKRKFEPKHGLRVVSSSAYSGFGETVRFAPQEYTRPEVSVSLRPIQITGGDAVTHLGGLHRVPKRDLVGVAQVALQTGRLKVSPALEFAGVLTRELQNFKVKIDLDTAHDSYGAWREGQHDDLVLAVCLALWIAHNDRTQRFFFI